MRIFEYECLGCGTRFEGSEPRGEVGPACPFCGNVEVRRLLPASRGSDPDPGDRVTEAGGGPIPPGDPEAGAEGPDPHRDQGA